MAVSPKRFKVALSFSGKYRAFIKRVGQRLSQDLTSDCVLYDEYHRAEFACLISTSICRNSTSAKPS